MLDEKARAPSLLTTAAAVTARTTGALDTLHRRSTPRRTAAQAAGVARTPGEETLDLFKQYRRTRDPEVRDRLVLLHLDMVRLLAVKFARRGEPLEDLVQVGTIGLIYAVDRFDPERGTKFTTFATPTILGEIKRYFRDATWVLGAPRSLRELTVQVCRANELLSQQLGRSPTIPEIAAHLGTPEEQILDAMELGHSYEPLSLDSPLHHEETDTFVTMEDEIGVVDAELQRLADYDDLRAALEHLDDRAKKIVYLRYFCDLTQTQVARRLGISQMQVSRLQRKALRRLKELLAEAADEQRLPLTATG